MSLPNLHPAPFMIYVFWEKEYESGKRGSGTQRENQELSTVMNLCMSTGFYKQNALKHSKSSHMHM